MSKVSIIFVPGSFCLPSFYQPIFTSIAKAGYDIKGIRLPSVADTSQQAPDVPAPPMYEDAMVIASEVEKLAGEGKDVVLIAHSYGGIPLSQSPKGLEKQERKAQGKAGGVVRLGYIAAVVPAEGKSSHDVLAARPVEQSAPMSMDDKGWLSLTDLAATAKIVAQDLPPEQGEAVARSFTKHSAAAYGSELSYAGYKNIPASWLFTEDDLAIAPEVQQAGIDAIEQASGRKVEVTKIKSGHCPNVSKEKETIEWILDVARKAEAS